MKLLDKIKLVSSARFWYKFWSIRLTALGSSVLAIWFMFNQEIILWWNSNAAEYFPMLEPQIIRWIGLFLVMASAFARVHKQKNIPPESVVIVKPLENTISTYPSGELKDEFKNE